MAKCGIQHVRYAKMTDGEKYTGGKEISKLIQFNGTPNKSSAEQWGDNGLAESDTSTKSYSLSMELTDLAGEVYADLCGHTYDESTKKVTIKSGDVAPYVGVGAIGNSIRNNKEVFVMKFYHKVKFGDPGDDNSTETETREFKSCTIEGKGYPKEDKTLKEEQEFETLTEAKAALDKLLEAAGG